MDRRVVRFGALYDFADGRLSIEWARDRFLMGGVTTMGKELGEKEQDEVPNVPLDLWENVFPTYREVRGEGRRPTTTELRTEGLRPDLVRLRRALLAWRKRHHLEESPNCFPSQPWVWEAALRTLEVWYREVKSRKKCPPHAMAPPLEKTDFVRFAPGGYQQHPQPLPESVTVLEFKNKEGEIWREDIDLFFVRDRNELVSRLVHRGASQEVVTSKLREIEGRLRELGYRPSRWKKLDKPPLTHFRWLALHQCANFSFRKVAEEHGQDRHNVTLAIRRTAELIGLKLRESPKGGRPLLKPS